jgi:hypothetical protein
MQEFLICGVLKVLSDIFISFLTSDPGKIAILDVSL